MYIELPTVSKAVGDIINTGEDWQTANFPRKISRMALVGGAAANDAEVQVFYGQQWIATLKNFKTGAVDKTKLLWHNSGLYCAAGTPIIIKCTDAFSATKTCFAADIVRFTPRKRFRRF